MNNLDHNYHPQWSYNDQQLPLLPNNHHFCSYNTTALSAQQPSHRGRHASTQQPSSNGQHVQQGAKDVLDKFLAMIQNQFEYLNSASCNDGASSTSETTMTNAVHLPSSFTKKGLHLMYVDHCKSSSSNEQSVSITTFKATLKAKFKRLVFGSDKENINNKKRKANDDDDDGDDASSLDDASSIVDDDDDDQDRGGAFNPNW